MNATLLTALVLVTAGLAALPTPALGAAYHVANDGDNANDGRTPAAALKTLAEAASRAERGDTILLRRGDVFRESVEVQTPDVVIDAYGPADADLPVISGSVPVTGWKPYKDSIYVAQTHADLGYLYVNGALMTIARYPNTGWLRTNDWTELPRPGTEGGARRRRSGGRTILRCPALAEHRRNAPGYWVGANIRWRHHSWWYETRPIEADDGAGELTLGDRSFSDHGPSEWDRKGWGFYLDGKLEELDAPGEWFFDAERGKVYLYPPDGTDPNELQVEGSALSTGLSVTDSVVRHVCFRHQKDAGLTIAGRCVVEGCRFESIGRDATPGERSAGGAALHAVASIHDTRVRYNEFRNNLNHSIAWWQGPEGAGVSVIEHNVILNSGVVPGYGGSGAWHAVGILIGRGTNVQVRNNRIDGTGYAGILLGSDGNSAEYNFIRNAMATLNDGAGIYTNCSRSTIRHNIILDVKGGMESSGTWPNISHGIWLEFLRNYRESVVEGNTCAGCGADGLFLTNNYECLVRGNVFYDNGRYQMLLSGRGEANAEDTTQEHLIVSNLLYATRAPQRLLYFDPRFDYGTLKGNAYFCPYTDEAFVPGHGWPGSNEPGISLADWQRDYTWADAEALSAPATPDAPDRSRLFYNDSEFPKTIALKGAWRTPEGTPVGDSIELAPFTSRILVRAERPQ